MTGNEKGFTLLELAIVVAISAALALGVSAFAFHALGTTQHTNDRLTVVSNVENAGFWLSRDACMADRVLTENLTAPAIVIIKWTDWGYDTDNVYYSATYSMEDVTGGIGLLKRRLESSAGMDQTVLVASNVYFDTGDPANSTNITYVTPTINMRLATRYGNASEVREYHINRRPNF